MQLNAYIYIRGEFLDGRVHMSYRKEHSISQLGTQQCEWVLTGKIQHI